MDLIIAAFAAKMAFFAVSIVIVMIGLVQLTFGIGKVSRLPETSFLGAVKIHAGKFPAGLFTALLGALLFFLVSQWQVTKTDNGGIFRAKPRVSDTVTQPYRPTPPLTRE